MAAKTSCWETPRSSWARPSKLRASRAISVSLKAKPMVNRVIVVGGGSAGYLAAITLKARMPVLSVKVIRSKAIGIIGVGEATTPVLPIHLHRYLRLGLREFYEAVHPQWKLGIRFLWGNRPWFDYVFNLQMALQHQNLPKVAAFYCSEGPFDYVGLPSSLMTHNKAFVRRPDGARGSNEFLAYHLENEIFVTYLERHACAWAWKRSMPRSSRLPRTIEESRL